MSIHGFLFYTYAFILLVTFIVQYYLILSNKKILYKEVDGIKINTRIVLLKTFCKLLIALTLIFGDIDFNYAYIIFFLL